MTDLLPLIPYDTALDRVGDPARPHGFIIWLPPSHPFLANHQTHPLVVDARLAYADYEAEGPDDPLTDPADDPGVRHTRNPYTRFSEGDGDG